MAPVAGPSSTGRRDIPRMSSTPAHWRTSGSRRAATTPRAAARSRHPWGRSLCGAAGREMSLTCPRIGLVEQHPLVLRAGFRWPPAAALLAVNVRRWRGVVAGAPGDLRNAPPAYPFSANTSPAARYELGPNRVFPSGLGALRVIVIRPRYGLYQPSHHSCRGSRPLGGRLARETRQLRHRAHRVAGVDGVTGCLDGPCRSSASRRPRWRRRRSC